MKARDVTPGMTIRTDGRRATVVYVRTWTDLAAGGEVVSLAVEFGGDGRRVDVTLPGSADVELVSDDAPPEHPPEVDEPSPAPETTEDRGSEGPAMAPRDRPVLRERPIVPARGGWAPASQAPSPKDWAPLGAAELAARVGVRPQTVRRWRMDGKLPDADWRVGGREVWAPETIDGWAKATGRVTDGR